MKHNKLFCSLVIPNYTVLSIVKSIDLPIDNLPFFSIRVKCLSSFVANSMTERYVIQIQYDCT